MYKDVWFEIAETIMRYKNKNNELPSIENEDKYVRYMAKWLRIQLNQFANLEDDKKAKLVELINVI